jgi:hypothetical protein
MIRRRHPPAGPEDLGAAGGLLIRRIFLRSGVFAGALGSPAFAESLTAYSQGRTATCLLDYQPHAAGEQGGLITKGF